MQELRIKEVMQEKGVTQKKLAEQMGVAEISLSRSLRGNPTLETLSKIAEALEVDIVDLFERKKEEENTIICPKCGSKFKLIE
ncbi:helix-turn-helix domain-containing protein [Bacteroides caccae]|jgi:transcriptional regulator with XRE-family HTH domain|uniref:helix-turn-helix domain-containing protein n=1 Tax=Bacteroides caccae TaxID=47678 RepID=UPI001F405896|nr:helix-turn-helix transcriptional regulator [Bacteroides caccae]MCE8774381.1 helix-turn-helix transcriptional regulator [Bacteroides caccae]